MTQGSIFITTHDYERLKQMINCFKNIWIKDQNSLEKLQSELDRANIVPSLLVGHDVVTMNSRVKLKDIDTQETMEYEVVFPQEANLERNKLSILAPVGTALLGYRIGDKIRWEVPAGVRTLEIVQILYQPEAAGEHDL
jgi:regulator of nucleoside diphosphate kinase